MVDPTIPSQVERVGESLDAAVLTHEATYLKHLEFIQAAITRQAGNQSLIRGWALTLATAFWDITDGSNPEFSTGSGWDAITGIGSPNVDGLLTVLRRLLNAGA